MGGGERVDPAARGQAPEGEHICPICAPFGAPRYLRDRLRVRQASQPFIVCAMLYTLYVLRPPFRRVHRDASENASCMRSLRTRRASHVIASDRVPSSFLHPVCCSRSKIYGTVLHCSPHFSFTSVLLGNQLMFVGAGGIRDWHAQQLHRRTLPPPPL